MYELTVRIPVELLATAKRLHELLEATRLGLSLTTGLGGLVDLALPRAPLLGQILGAVLELRLGRASRGCHVPHTPRPAGPLR